jgi:hypothetical protein
MQLEYRLSLKDYQEANQAHLKLQRWVYFFFWFFILLGLFSIIIYFVSGRQLDVFVIIYLLVFPTILVNPYFSNPIKNSFISRIWKGLPTLHHPITIEVNEEVLKIKTINSESSIQWQLYTKAVETKSLFMLYEAKMLFYMIPKRAFRSDEQVEEFRELLRTKIEKFQQL